ncbi:phage holin family protein [Butyrivibrio sp. WCE2006]|uniref:phage holin family protein n=1 Tax=Butyrivibrio sp. WCE2006 TaxID=1410611 RepID=UPI0005D1680F|nr:phage holin family protein [Butyrivibrio sp. WCE2006]
MEIKHEKSVVRDGIFQNEIQKWSGVREETVNTKLESIEKSRLAKIDAEKSAYDLKMMELEKDRLSINNKPGLGGLGWVLFVISVGCVITGVIAGISYGEPDALLAALFYAGLAVVGFLLIKRGKKKANNLKMYDQEINDTKAAYNGKIQAIDKEAASMKEAESSSGKDDNQAKAKQRGEELVAEYDMKVSEFKNRIMESVTIDLGFVINPIADVLKNRYEALKLHYPKWVDYEVSVEYDVQSVGVGYEVHDGFERLKSIQQGQVQHYMIYFSDNRMKSLSEDSQKEGLALVLAEKIDKRISQVFERENYTVEYSILDSKVTIKMNIACLDHKIELKGWDEGKKEREWEDVSQDTPVSDDSSVQYW